MTLVEDQARSLFLAALDRGPDQWPAFLAEACGDAAVRARVEDLLRAHQALGSIHAGGGGPATAADWSPPERPGAVVGPYKLLEQIGEGGFGVVFMAQQAEPIRRRVALKVLKPGMDSRQVVARFEAERQALALMDHPNIARVLDAGTTDRGRPFFVMELVRGVPITDFCDQGRLAPRERLGLFLAVCRAVQHAHQKGVIHRDLKPSNVLVTLHDGVPVPKVIDFGVAKALGQQLTDRTLFTGFAQMVGTPLYMSPEQAAMSGLDVDTRSDIYTLGVLLYELLTGTTPFDRERLRRAGYDELCRILREEEPPAPSARLSTLGPAATALSTQRQSDPKRLSRLCRGELDWVAMKCLEKDRNRRYETAAALVADVERYLADEPVHACPPSAAYRLKKFLRRNKRPALAAALVLLALVGGVIGTTWGMLRATDAEADARGQAGQKERALVAARASERDAKAQLFRALVHQARALQHSGNVGARSEGLRALDEAAALAPTLGPGNDHVLELRKEVIACLSQTNLTPERHWEALAPGSRGLAFDADLRFYARGERRDVSVRRVEDDREVVRLDGILTLLGDPTFMFSPDGAWLAVRDWVTPTSGRVTVWDLGRRRPLTALDASDFDFHPGGCRAAAAFADGSVRLYDLGTGESEGSLASKQGGDSLYLRYNPQGTKLAVSRWGDREIQVWDTATLSLDKKVSLPEPVWAPIAWHPGGRLLAAGSGNRVLLHDLDTARTTILPGHQTAVTRLAFNPGGDLLASMSWDPTARLWDVRTGRQLLQIPANRCPQFGRDDRHLATLYGRTATVFTIERSAEYRAFPCLTGKTGGFGDLVQFSPDGGLLGVAGDEGVRFWSLATGETAGLMPLPRSRSVLFDPAGTHLITTGPHGVHLWPVRRGREAGAVHWRIGPPEALAGAEISDANFAALSRDGRTLVVVPAMGTAAVLDVPARRVTARLAGHANLTYVAISPDGRWVATGPCNGQETVVWDAGSGKPVIRWPHFRGLTGVVTFSPDGKWLVTSVGSDARLIDSEGWQVRRTIPNSGGEFFSRAAFCGDGKVLAVADTPHEVKLQDPTTGSEYAALSLPRDLYMGDLCLSPDGCRLAARTTDDLVHVWDLRRIRHRLAAMKLDWELPPLPPPPGDADVPVRVEVDLGELAPGRQALARYRRALEANPDDAAACNDAAWVYATGPADLRDPDEALRLARNAVRLAPDEHNHWNTLGVAYYRLGRWQEAEAALQDAARLDRGKAVAWDQFFLAMCYQRLGRPEKARDCYRRADEWWQAQTNLPPEWAAELEAFRTEAASVLGLPAPAP